MSILSFPSIDQHLSTVPESFIGWITEIVMLLTLSFPLFQYFLNHLFFFLLSCIYSFKHLDSTSVSSTFSKLPTQGHQHFWPAIWEGRVSVFRSASFDAVPFPLKIFLSWTPWHRIYLVFLSPKSSLPIPPPVSHLVLARLLFICFNTLGLFLCTIMSSFPTLP